MLMVRNRLKTVSGLPKLTSLRLLKGCYKYRGNYLLIMEIYLLYIAGKYNYLLKYWQ